MTCFLHKKFSQSKIIVLIIVSLLYKVECFSQNDSVINNLSYKESYLNLPEKDSVLKKEIASFNIKGEIFNTRSVLLHSKLKEISYLSCSEEVVFFNHCGGGTYVSVYFKEFNIINHKLTYDENNKIVLIDNYHFWGVEGTIPKREIDSIRVVLHSKVILFIPDSAYIGIYEPSIICEEKKGKKYSNYFKVFKSKDKRRLYIYMLNGQGIIRYEVTWIIKDGRYYGRVIDLVPDLR